MSDQVLVKMPDNLYQFLQALAVIQDYQVQLAVGAQRGQRDSNYQVTFRMDEKFKYFESCMRVVHDNIPIFDYSGWDEEQRREYDCFIRFDASMYQRAEKISNVMHTHICAGLNTLIGAGATPFPVTKPLQLTTNKDKETDVLIFSWDAVEADKLYDFIFNNYPQLSIIVDSRDMDTYSPEEIINYINHFKCVIGPTGVGTYIATILKKVVLELFKTNEEGKLYGFSGAPGYWAAIGEKHTATYLWTVWEDRIWPELSSKMSNQSVQASMERQPFIVGSVEEKSGDNPIPRSEQ